MTIIPNIHSFPTGRERIFACRALLTSFKFLFLKCIFLLFFNIQRHYHSFYGNLYNTKYIIRERKVETIAKRVCKPFILLLTAVLLVTFVVPQISQASEFSNSQVKSYSDSGDYSEKELEEILKFYFEEVGELTNEGYVIKTRNCLIKSFGGRPCCLEIKRINGVRLFFSEV